MIPIISEAEQCSSFISFGKVSPPVGKPRLVDIQIKSYDKFLQTNVPVKKRKNTGLQSVFLEFFPIESSNKDVFLEFVEYYLGEPKKDVWDCKESDSSYAAPLKALIRLISVESGEVREQEVYMGDIPVMTSTGTFIINGAERVVVNQLHRSPGIFIFLDEMKDIYTTRIIPDHKGSWLEFELDNKGLLVARIDRRKKFPFTLLVRCLGYSTNEEILRFFYEAEPIDCSKESTKKLRKYLNRRVIANIVHPKTKDILVEAGETLNEDNIDIIKESGVASFDLIIDLGIGDDQSVIQSMLKDGVSNQKEALAEFLKIQRPLEYVSDQGDPEKQKQNLERANAELKRLFFDPKTYDMGVVGRYKINAKFKMINPEEFNDDIKDQTLRPVDIMEALRFMIKAVNEIEGYQFDDIDHLGNRRVRTVGELLTLQLKTGFSRMERVVKERMTMNDMDIMTPQLLISIKPITALLNEFFGASQLSQFMDQTNPLSELTHKRRLNALGPGGLTRERAGFEVRDVHYTHYGRVCPIETPEGPNIGLIASMAVYARLNPYGFLETPYLVVEKGRVTGKSIYLSANEEDHYVVAQSNSRLGKNGEFLDNLVSCRYRGDFPLKSPEEIQMMEVDPLQVVSLSTGIIPFLEHDDANRALMGSNMQRQAVPLLYSEAPIVGTGLERIVAYDSGVCVVSHDDGVVVKVSSELIEILEEKNKEVKKYPLIKYRRTNQSTCVNHEPLVQAHFAPETGTIEKITAKELIFSGESGQKYSFPMETFQGKLKPMVKASATVAQNELLAGEIVHKEICDSNGNIKKPGSILADGQACHFGRLSLGRNIMVAFMPGTAIILRMPSSFRKTW